MNSKRRSLTKSLPAFGLALIASLAFAAFAAASASATTEHWYECTTGTGEGQYEDSHCATAKTKGLYHLHKLGLGTPTGFTATGATNFVLTWGPFGGTSEISCTTETSENGTLENPKEAEIGVQPAGTAEVTFKLSGCKDLKASACIVSPITILNAKGPAVAEYGGKPAPAVHLVPQSEGILVEYGTSKNCPHNGQQFILHGSFWGIVNNATSTLEITPASTEMWLNGGVVPVTIEARGVIATAGGKFLSLAP